MEGEDDVKAGMVRRMSVMHEALTEFVDAFENDPFNGNQTRYVVGDTNGYPDGASADGVMLGASHRVSAGMLRRAKHALSEAAYAPRSVNRSEDAATGEIEPVEADLDEPFTDEDAATLGRAVGNYKAHLADTARLDMVEREKLSVDFNDTPGEINHGWWLTDATDEHGPYPTVRDAIDGVRSTPSEGSQP